MDTAHEIGTGDMTAATATYSGFISLIKYALPIIALIAALVIWLIAG